MPPVFATICVQASPAAALPRAGIFSHHVGSWSQCWSWTALGFNCPQRRVSIGGLDTGQWSPVLQSHGGSLVPPCYHQDTGRLRRIRVRDSTSWSLLCYEQGQVSVLPVPCPQYELVRGLLINGLESGGDGAHSAHPSHHPGTAPQHALLTARYFYTYLCMYLFFCLNIMRPVYIVYSEGTFLCRSLVSWSRASGCRHTCVDIDIDISRGIIHGGEGCVTLRRYLVLSPPPWRSVAISR